MNVSYHMQAHNNEIGETRATSTHLAKAEICGYPFRGHGDRCTVHCNRSATNTRHVIVSIVYANPGDRGSVAVQLIDGDDVEDVLPGSLVGSTNADTTPSSSGATTSPNDAGSTALSKDVSTPLGDASPAAAARDLYSLHPRLSPLALARWGPDGGSDEGTSWSSATASLSIRIRDGTKREIPSRRAMEPGPGGAKERGWSRKGITTGPQVPKLVRHLKVSTSAGRMEGACAGLLL